MKLKRILAAVVLASLSVPALAAEYGPPFEQVQLDQTLPNVQNPVVSDSASGGATLFGMKEGAPYEQWKIDTALPNVKDPVTSQSAVAATPDTGSSFTEATGPWAHDFNFIAPAA